MEARRASSPSRRPASKFRLLLRVYAAESLRHLSSQGTFVKISVEAGEPLPATRGSSHGSGHGTRASLKRLLHGSARANHHQHHHPHSPEDPSSGDDFARRAQTGVQKSPHGRPVWNEKFELPVFDPASDVLHLRVKSARLLAAPAVGAAALALRDVPRAGESSDQWINLFDNSRKPAGRLRIQVRLVSTAAMLSMSASMPVIVAPSTPDAGTTEERDTYYQHPRRTSSTRSAPSPTPTLPRSNRRGAIIAPPIGGVGAFRRSSTLSRSLLDARTSGSTTASDSISSDSSADRGSVPVVAPYTPTDFGDKALPSPPPPTVPSAMALRDTDVSSVSSGRCTAAGRTTALSVASAGRDTELDFLASKYMAKPARAASVRTTIVPGAGVQESMAVPPSLALPEHDRRSSRQLAQREVSSPAPKIVIQEEEEEENEEEQPVSASSSAAGSPPAGPSLSEIKLAAAAVGSLVSKAATKSPKDERSPRTTNTTAVSSDDDEPGEATIEFDFDTGDVRPSTRLPSHMMRSTVTRSSIATSRIESDDESDSDSDDEQEDDEMDPDGDPDGPRMVLRATVTRLLRRDSVNVIMDVDEEDEDDDEFELDPFVFDELPILDMSDTLLQIKDIDCTDHAAAAAAAS